MRCLRCGQWVWVWPLQLPVCRRLEECLERRWRRQTQSLDLRMTYQPPRIEPVFDLPEPPDPLEPGPPEDIEVCSLCKGSGEIVHGRRDWETGAYDTIVCPHCGGDSFEPGYRPWAGADGIAEFVRSLRWGWEPR